MKLQRFTDVDFLPSIVPLDLACCRLEHSDLHPNTGSNIYEKGLTWIPLSEADVQQVTFGHSSLDVKAARFEHPGGSKTTGFL